MKLTIISSLCLLTCLGLAAVKATAAPAPLINDGCMGAFEQGFPAPPFECPFGQPNPQCLADAQIAYEQYMQMASFTLCETLSNIEAWYELEVQDCLKYYDLCINSGEGPELMAACNQQLHDCIGPMLTAKQGMIDAAYAQYAQDMADAQDAFYSAALECCPQ